jgi:hypothetical protein
MEPGSLAFGKVLQFLVPGRLQFFDIHAQIYVRSAPHLGGGDQCPQTIIQELPVILFKLSRHQI